jgi:uncharacterized membrane protein
MPFCSHCGAQVSPTDGYCASCGARQAGGTAVPDPLKNLSPQTAAILCYIPMIGWIASVIVLAVDHLRRDHDLRFHAYQGIYLFVAWLLVDYVVGPMLLFGAHSGFRIERILKLVVFGTSVFMMVKTSQRQRFELPIIGELAERTARES